MILNDATLRARRALVRSTGKFPPAVLEHVGHLAPDARRDARFALRHGVNAVGLDHEGSSELGFPVLTVAEKRLAGARE